MSNALATFDVTLEYNPISGRIAASVNDDHIGYIWHERHPRYGTPQIRFRHSRAASSRVLNAHWNLFDLSDTPSPDEIMKIVAERFAGKLIYAWQIYGATKRVAFDQPEHRAGRQRKIA
jgi:hypothetical protein